MHAFVQPASCCLLFSPLTNRDPDQGPPPLALRVVRAQKQPRTGLPCRPQQEFHSCHGEGSWNASRQLSSALTELQKPANRLPTTASGTVKAGPPTSNTQQPGQDFRKLPALKAVPFRASKAKQGLGAQASKSKMQHSAKSQRGNSRDRLSPANIAQPAVCRSPSPSAAGRSWPGWVVCLRKPTKRSGDDTTGRHPTSPSEEALQVLHRTHATEFYSRGLVNMQLHEPEQSPTINLYAILHLCRRIQQVCGVYTVYMLTL